MHLVSCNASAGRERGATAGLPAEARTAERRWHTLKRPTRESQANTTEAESADNRTASYPNSAGGGTTRGNAFGRDFARPNDSSTKQISASQDPLACGGR